jgi:L-fuculose-phosphate aldolase
MVLLLGEIPCLPYLTLGSETLAHEVAKAATDANGVLMAHHGAVTWGRDLNEAWYRTQALEQYCRQLWLQLQMGGTLPVIPEDEVNKLIARRIAGGTLRGGGIK